MNRGSVSMESADVSVVIPCFNAEATIDRALASVAAQTLQPSEVLCIDDGSSDDTYLRLTTFQSQEPTLNIRILKNDHQRGPAYARNIGWNAAIGKYTAFLDADDSWREDKLSLQIGFMEAAPDAVITGHRVARADESLGKDGSRTSPFRPLSYREILMCNRLLTPSVVIKRTIQERFDESMQRCEDYMLWCVIMSAGNKAFFSSDSLAFVHKGYYGESGLSESIFTMAKWEALMYVKLLRSKRISAASFVVLMPWLMSKVTRRYVLSVMER